jgi:hypothetical protein
MSGQRFFERREQLHQRGFQLGLEIGRILELALALRLAKPLDETLRRGRAHVGAEELGLQVLVDRLVDLRRAAQDVERALPALARALEVLLEESGEGFHAGGNAIFYGMIDRR